ncbi:MAG: hypothetical protein AAF533_17935 [Acidobacteriota bacterium]
MGWFDRFRAKKKETFKERVEAFWAWWTEESESLLARVGNSEDNESLQRDVGEAVTRLGLDFAWEFGPGPEGDGHSFALSPSGDRNRLFLVSYWRSRAPELPGWTFHASRQPFPESGDWAINLGGTAVAPKDVLLDLAVDEEREVIHVFAWCEAFEELEEDQARRHLFLLVDAVLGENGTERWVGVIEQADRRPDAAVPLSRLREWIQAAATERGWEDRSPEDVYTVYGLEEPIGDFPRGDTIGGTTRNTSILGAYLEEGGPIEDPVEGTGAEYLFAVVPGSVFPAGEETSVRAELEDALQQRLGEAQSGMVLGGAMGRDAGYVDLLVFDGDRSRELIEEVFAARGLTGHRLESFVR